jgi:hypothetical protein
MGGLAVDEWTNGPSRTDGQGKLPGAAAAEAAAADDDDDEAAREEADGRAVPGRGRTRAMSVCGPRRMRSLPEGERTSEVICPSEAGLRCGQARTWIRVVAGKGKIRGVSHLSCRGAISRAGRRTVVEESRTHPVAGLAALLDVDEAREPELLAGEDEQLARSNGDERCRVRWRDCCRRSTEDGVLGQPGEVVGHRACVREWLREREAVREGGRASKVRQGALSLACGQTPG